MKLLSAKSAQRLWSALCLVAGALAALCVCVTGTYWNDLWFPGGFFRSGAYERATEEYVSAAREAAELSLRFHYGDGSHSYLDQERSDQLERLLDPQQTNFRCAIHTQDGEDLGGTLANGQELADVADGLCTEVIELTLSTPTETAGGETDSYPVYTAVLEYGSLADLPYPDGIRTARVNYDRLCSTWLPLIAGLAVVFCILTACLLPKVWRAARRRSREAGLRLFARLPYDLHLVLGVLVAICLLLPGDDILRFFWREPFRPLALAGLLLLFAAYVLVALDLFLSAAARWGRLWRHTLLCRLGAAVGSLAAHRRPALLFVLYLAGNTFLTLMIFTCLAEDTVLFLLPLVLLLVYNALAFTRLLRWAGRLHAVQEAALRDAVERETRSQRFQTELITNVSHDLKGPLTSIVTYTDLLRKAPAGDPAIPDYLDVLQRKSQRLKKLTEDLIEASKASSGMLPVTLAPISLGELLEQALGEYSDKFTQNSLEPVVAQPPREVVVLADGGHLWRVLDNLLSNCVKYSLPGTRIYLAVAREEDRGVVTMKNISAQPLNLPPQELLGRFVRGDAARATEGTGLGLSIAQNLTELQGGTLTLDIDGDLFKAAVRLPLAPPAESEP